MKSMKWKELPSWEKGAAIFIILGMLLVPIGILLMQVGAYVENCQGDVCNLGIISGIGFILILIPTWPFRFFNYSNFLNNSFALIILKCVVFVLQFFIIGAIIGWIVGKIKNKK